MPIKRIVIKEGDTAGICTVLEVDSDPANLQASQYKVKYSCCGREDWVGHKFILRHLKTTPVQCQACASGKLRKRNKERKLHDNPRKQEYVPGWGFTLIMPRRGQ